MPEPGSVVQERAGGVLHNYRLLRCEPYVTKDGRTIDSLTWEGCCVVCREPFQAFTTVDWRGHLPRACKAHRPWLAHAKGTPERAAWTRTLRRRRLVKGSSRAV